MLTNKIIECYAATAAGGELVPFSYPTPEVGPWDIEVEITHCGICHSDLHLILNDWKQSRYPLIPGHEIIGHIKQKGTLVDELELDQRVGIGWQRSSCTHCEWCHQGEENLCFAQEATCVGHHGGFAKSIVTDARLAFLIPEGLVSENAAPLLCGGATTFSPFIQHNVNASMRVGVIGIGGLGHLALQFARAFGCEVFAFSTSAEKEEEAKKLGAHHFISSRDPQALKRAASLIDLLLCTSSGEIDWPVYLETLRPKGKLCLLGVPKEGTVSVPIFSLIAQRKMICGSNIASAPDIRTMLRFAAQHHIAAQTEIFPMERVNEALKKLAANQIHYRAVLKNG
ncbi:MAG: Aldehyde reductase Ahr [Chlamydiales bacterium]|nr:Aldehyde reductase Ahr [Chlamydiales bacterium]